MVRHRFVYPTGMVKSMKNAPKTESPAIVPYIIIAPRRPNGESIAQAASGEVRAATVFG